MLKANDVAGQLHRLSQPRPQCLLVFQYGGGKKEDLLVFVLLFCLIKIYFTLYFAFTLTLSVLFPDPPTASPWPPF